MSKVKLLRSSEFGKAPNLLESGELAINHADRQIYIKDSNFNAAAKIIPELLPVKKSIILNGVDSRIEIPGDSIDSYAGGVSLLFYIPVNKSVSGYLLRVNYSGSQGMDLSVTDNVLYYRIKGANVANVNITTGRWHNAVIIWRHNGVSKLYVDGVLIGSSNSYLGDKFVVQPKISIGSNYSYGNFFKGEISDIVIFNTNEIEQLIGRGDKLIIPYKFLNASNTAYYHSDFSSDEDGRTGIRLNTFVGNIDGIAGDDDWLKGTANGDSNTHYIQIAKIYDGTLKKGKKTRVYFKYYIPADNTNVDGIDVVEWDGSALRVLDIYNTDGSPHTVSTGSANEIYVELTTSYSSIHVSVRQLAKGDAVFTGANASDDDKYYIKDIRVIGVGATAMYLSKNAGGNGIVDAGADELHARLINTETANIDNERDVVYEIVSDTVAEKAVPGNSILEYITFKNAGTDEITLNIGTLPGGSSNIGSITVPGEKTVMMSVNSYFAESRDIYIADSDGDNSWGNSKITAIFYNEILGA